MHTAALLLTMVLGTCPPEGLFGDPLQSRAKNRTEIPASYEVWPLEKVLALRNYPMRGGDRDRARWTREVRAEIEGIERHAISVTGYLLGTRAGPPEPANCNSLTRRDLHLYLGPKPALSETDFKGALARSLIVELTPVFRKAHPGWDVKTFEKLVRSGTPVRLKGWLMYDPEHPKTLHIERGTLWEIHPVLEIEVKDGDGWRKL